MLFLRLLVLPLVVGLPLALQPAGGTPQKPGLPDGEVETQRILAKHKTNVDKGLAWLAKQQLRDGHWEAMGGQYPVAMTGLAGLALLAEGSTLNQGKYSREIENAVDYLVNRWQKKTGQIGNPNDMREQQRYMYAHGFATLFLSQVYGEESDENRRKELEKILVGAVDFIGKAQTKLGGWGYMTAADGQDFDEGSVTITQLQALRACKNAGIPVPREIVEKACEYLKKSTMYARRDNAEPLKEEAGVIYSLRQGGGNIRPPLTAAGIASMFSAGEFPSAKDLDVGDGDDKLSAEEKNRREYRRMCLKWLNYCQRNIPIDKTGRDSFGHWEYTHFYFSQVIYVLGEDRHGKMRPDLAAQEKEGKKTLLKWSRYRETIYDYLASRQNPDGSWSQGYIGPVYTTSLHLIIMQLDKGHLPVYQR